MAAEIQIRHCTSLDEFDQCVSLERLIWGDAITVPNGIFVVAKHTGGQVLGAFDEDKLVGFTLALAGLRTMQPLLHSHMTAVLPDYQNRGLGRSLKIFQRRDALNRGIRLVEWTFDPLEIKNARFNLVRLGAIARRFIPNCYGVTASPAHAGLPTDRLLAEWWLDSERVRRILSDSPPSLASDAVRVSIPMNVSETKFTDATEAATVQRHLGQRLQRRLVAGYVVTGIEPHISSADYILEPAAEIDGLQLPPIHND